MAESTPADGSLMRHIRRWSRSRNGAAAVEVGTEVEVPEVALVADSAVVAAREDMAGLAVGREEGQGAARVDTAEQVAVGERAEVTAAELWAIGHTVPRRMRCPAR